MGSRASFCLRLASFWQVVLAAGLLSALGCGRPSSPSTAALGATGAGDATDEEDDGDDAEPWTRLKITSPKSSGSLCPRTNGLVLRPAGAGLLLRGPTTNWAPGSKPTCTVSFDLQVPAGYQIGPLHTLLRGVSTSAALSRWYAFEGSAQLGPLRGDLDDGGYVLDDLPTGNLWSNTCGENHVARFVILAEASLNDDLAAIQLDKLEVDAHPVEGVAWRRCGGSTPVALPKAKLGSECGGASGRECLEGLQCATRSATSSGTCIDPAEPVGAVPRGYLCDESRSICEKGLTCVYLSERDRLAKSMGSCVPSVISRNAPCNDGTSPTRSCEAGLDCVMATRGSHSECIPRDGQNGNACRPQNPACDDGLSCRDRHCLPDEADPNDLGNTCATNRPCRNQGECIFPRRKTGVCRPTWSSLSLDDVDDEDEDDDDDDDVLEVCKKDLPCPNGFTCDYPFASVGTCKTSSSE